MAQYTAYANYVIYFSDPAEYAAAVAFCGGVGYGHCPRAAATQFGLTYPPPTTIGTKGMYGLAPYGIPVFAPGYNIPHPLPSGVFLMANVDSVLVPGQLPSPPYSPAGPDMLLVWWGVIVQINDVAGGTTPPQTSIPRRRFIGGSEPSGANEEGGAGGNNDAGCRDSSRTINGKGLPIRGTNGIVFWTRQQDEFIAGLLPKTTWERFYIRVNTLGTNICGVWRGRAKVNTNIAASIKVDNATGVIKIYTTTSGGVETLRGTGATALTLGKWYLIDTIIQFNSGAGTDGRFRVWISHALELDYVDSTGGSLDTNDTHGNSQLGQYTTAEAQWSIDLDDWIGADVPNILGVESLTSIDWLIGSHVRRLDALSSVHTGYTGNHGTLNQGFNPGAAPVTSECVSTTALATIQALMDASNDQIYPGQVFGIAAMWLGVYSYQNPLGIGRLGYSVAGGAFVYAAQTDTGAFRWNGILYNPAGLSLPQVIEPFSIIKEKPDDVVNNRIWAFTAVVEYIGVWGTEDQAGTLDLTNSTRLYRHNCRYANTIWGTPVMGPPTAPCFSVGGTYVGNGTVQDINLPAPAHFIWIRALTGGSLGVRYFAASLGAHDGNVERFRPNEIVRAWIDSAGQAKFTVCGADDESNNIGVTYQYIAFCDPGMRFNFCGAYNAPPALTSLALPLFVTDFLAGAGFTQRGFIGSLSNTVALSYKGPGHAGNTGQTVAGVAQANWGSFAAGILTVRADNIASIRDQRNFSLWRTTDPDSGSIAVQIHSYTGDGNALQIVNLPLTTGRWPLLAVVFPHNALGYFRDPSHTGVNSASIITLVTGTTAIMGGAIDQLFVGITLNAIGIVYDVFVIMGDNDGWNNGTFHESSSFSKGPWVPPTFAPTTEPTVVGDGGMKFNGDLTPISLFKTISGIYTLVLNKHTDTFYTGAGATTIEEKIPNPRFKTGYIGG